MHGVRRIKNNLYYVGCNDVRLHLFENLFPLPDGVAYNSYLLLEEKTILFDTVDGAVSKQFLENITYLLANRPLDYLFINHMELDHSELIEEILYRYPLVRLVLTSKALQMLNNYLDRDVSANCQIVKEGEELTIANHTFCFVAAPMVHWPEVMVTVDKTDKILFSADAFGSFGTLKGNIFLSEVDLSENLIFEMRRYYTNIVGKYGVQVQALLKKISTFQLELICPLHGHVIDTHISELVSKYNLWSNYQCENEGVCIIYASMYGSTQSACNCLAMEMAECGVRNIKVYDVSQIDVSFLIAEVFRYKNLVLACPTYNGGLYPKMEHLLLDMKDLNVANKNVCLIENGTWGAVANKQMKDILLQMKNIHFVAEDLKLVSILKNEQLESIKKIAEIFASLS